MALFSQDMCLLSGPPCPASTREAAVSAASTIAGNASPQDVWPRRVYPLTKSQEGMWYEFQNEPSSTKYHLTLEWDLRRNRNQQPSLNDVLEVISKLTNRHIVLRSMIKVVDNRPTLQEYTIDDVEANIQVIHRHDSAVSEPAMKRILRKPIDLSSELPARWVILKDAISFRLYLVGQHIAVDGQSMSIISKEFLDLLDNRDAKLGPVPDFGAMHMIEKAWTGSQSYLNSRAVLLDQARNMNTAPWPKAIVTKTPSSRNYRDIDSWATFPKADLETWSKQFKTSWFRVATTLVGLLVNDMTRPALGRDEVVSVGFASRPGEMAGCIGQFANALPVRVPLWETLAASTNGKGDRSLKSLVSAVGKHISAVKKAELFPATEVVRAARDCNVEYRSPRVAITYSPKLARSECRMFPVEGSWDLFFCFLEHDEDVKLGVIYNPAIFSTKTIGLMKASFQRMISLSRADGTMLDDMLTWLPQHISLPASPKEPQANPLTHIHHWFDAHAESNPDGAALSSSELGQFRTYRTLFVSSENKAKYLISSGIQRNQIVLLQLSRGFQVIEWILAVLKSGAAFVYLDPELSEVQKSAIVNNCRPSIIIDDDSAANFSRNNPISAYADIDLVSVKYGTKDTDLAYMIYTSGSTGQPKGVMVEHGSIAAFVRASTDVFECGYGTRILQLASFSFDASILEWTAALCTGATLCFAKHPKHLVGEYLADVIEGNAVTFFQVTPTALETLPMTREFPSLRQISVGGEAPSKDILARWHPRVNLVNAYGPTEAAVAVAFNKIDRTEEMPEAVTVGRPTPTTDIYICSEDFASFLQPECPGEVCLAGPQIARGYCGQPEVTARQFADGPNGDRMYRTGDRGLLLEDGSLVIMGRIDRDLKVRGFRIAPEEIERAILEAGVGVAEASVQLSDNGLEMVALVSPETASPRELKSALKRLLASYKVPSQIYALPSLPKNVAGKIDHKAARAMRPSQLVAASPVPSGGVDSGDDAAGDTNPNTSDEDCIVSTPVTFNDDVLIADIWKEVLGVSSSPPPDVNFFDIGGHSLLVPKLHDKLKSAFPNRHIRLVDLFHQATIKQQAALLGDGHAQPQQRRVSSTSITKRARTRSVKSAMSVSSSRPTSFSARSSMAESTTTPATSVASEPVEGAPGIAITGMAGRFPGAQSADEFYAKLMEGSPAFTTAATTEPRKTLPGNTWVPRAGTLQNIEDFDHDFWNLSEEEATEMDPQQRVFLEVAHEALTDAGIDFNTMNGGRVGLFIGAANPSYHHHTESVASDPFLRENRGYVAPSISARTAYHLNIRGPNVTVQTNCASSTVALSQAADAIRLGRCDIAIVGGVCIALHEGGYVTRAGQIFSAVGDCRPFDATADGTVPADAVTAVVLKRYSESVAEGTPVYARIMGTGIGSDGALEKAGYQVPSPRGQAEVIKSAWKAARLAPEKLRYSEVHGSGTPVGDALELEGLSLAIKELGGTRSSWAVGSIKGNMGNAQHASGLVSLIKLCKSMQAGAVPATRGFTTPNDMIDRGLPLAVASMPIPLARDDLLSVSASGWGGVNSHVILAFPDERLQKRSTIALPGGTWKRKTLAAPRLQAFVKTTTMKAAPTATATTTSIPITTVETTPSSSAFQALHSSPTQSLTSSPPLDVVTNTYVQSASSILKDKGIVGPDTNLRALGMDSMAYISIVSMAADKLGRLPLGAKGLLLPACSPAALAKLHEEQQQANASAA